MSKGSMNKQLLHFIAEAGMLKRVRRSGWSVVGIEDAESVAEHSFRCAVLGYLLAGLEKAAADKVLVMTLFNDIHEARIGDVHKMACRYLDLPAAEDRAFAEQTAALPQALRQQLRRLRKEYLRQNTAEAIIARDADILECLLQAKEYDEHGFRQAAKFMQKAPEFLRTKSARRLWRTAQKTTLSEWWSGLSRFQR